MGRPWARGQVLRQRKISAEFEYGNGLTLDEENVRAIRIRVCTSRGEAEKAREVFAGWSSRCGFEDRHKNCSTSSAQMRKAGCSPRPGNTTAGLETVRHDENLHTNGPRRLGRAACERRMALKAARPQCGTAVAAVVDYRRAKKI